MTDPILSTAERASLLGGGHPTLRFPTGTATRLVGTTIEVSAAMRIRVTDLHRVPGKPERILEYVVQDDRPDLVRRVPPIHAPRRGERRDPTGGEIARAARESAVTHAPHEAVTDAGEVVPEHFQRQLTAEGHARMAGHRDELAADDEERRQQRVIRDRLRERLDSLDRAGRVRLLAAIEREIQQAE